MLISLSDQAQQMAETVTEVAVSSDGIALERLNRPSHEVRRIADFRLSFDKTDGHSLAVRGSTEVEVSMPCSRCLTEVGLVIPLVVDRTFGLVDELVVDDPEDPLSAFEDGMLDVEALLAEELLLALPAKALCRPDCKGLCPSCGANLNQSECGCDRFVPDPRMQQFLDVFREG